MLKTKEAANVRLFFDDTAATACVIGEIDHHSAIAIRRTIDEFICQRKPRILRLDASAVTFMDSSGLGLILGRLALLQKCGGELILFHPSAEVARMMHVAGMERLIKIEE